MQSGSVHGAELSCHYNGWATSKAQIYCGYISDSPGYEWEWKDLPQMTEQVREMF